MFRTSNRNPRNSVVFAITCYFTACKQFVVGLAGVYLAGKTRNHTIDWNFDIILPFIPLVWSLASYNHLALAFFGPVLNVNTRDCENCYLKALSHEAKHERTHSQICSIASLDKYSTEWSTAVIRDRVRDHDIATPALLCHKEPAKGI